jgi:small subunit ribosomal protein S2
MKELEMIFEEYSRGEGIYLKKEIIEFQKEYNKLNKKFGGVKNMENLPDVLIVVDPVKEQLAVNEARILKIPIIAICDTNADPDLIDYPIPANDDAIKSVSLIISYISDAIIKGKESLKWQI